MVQGLRVMTPASLWATYGPELSLANRVALGDAIIRTPRIGGRNLRSSDLALANTQLLLQAAEVPGRRRRRLLLEALPLLREGVASAPESHLRLTLLRHGIEEPTIDFDVYSPSGRYLGTSELAFPKFRVALEYEGDHHRIDRRQWYRDIEKYESYREAGWEVIRVTSQALYRSRPQLMATIRSALKRRGWAGSV